MKRLLGRRPALLVLSVFVASCSGDGCGCTTTIPGGFPAADRVENAIQLRVTDTGIAALEADPAGLVGGLLGGGPLEFEVPPSCGSPAVCCDGSGNPITPCGPILIDLVEQNGDLPRLEVDPIQSQSQIDVIVRARITTAAGIPFSATGLDCVMDIDTTAGNVPDIRLELDMDMAIDPTGGADTTRLTASRAEVFNFESADLSVGGGGLCFLADLGFVKDIIIGQLEDTLSSTLVDTVEQSFCKTCNDVSDCGGFATSCDDGICNNANGCYQEVGIAGRMQVAELVGGFSSGQSGALDIYDVAGGYNTSNSGGIAIGLYGGMLSASAVRDRCGPESTRPAAVSVPQSAFFQGNTRPDTAEAFDVGIGIHAHNLDMFSWAFYESGTLCMNIGTSTVDLLNTDTLGLLFQSITDLMHDSAGQVVLGLRPQSPPVIVLGTGTTLPDGTIDDPLLDVTFTDLDLDFFVMVDDQFIRAMTVTTDVNLPLNLDVNADGEIVPVLGEIDNAFTNVRVTNSEALLETPEELADKFPVLLDVALPLLGDGLGGFALPDLGGIQLEVAEGGITSIESNSFLAIFATLAAAPAAMPRVVTEAELSRVSVPEKAAFQSAQLDASLRPQVELRVGGHLEDGTYADLEWSHRLDGGLWSPYSRSRNIVVSRNALWIQAEHTIEVRARQVGEPGTTDRTPVVLRPVIDRAPPRATFLNPMADMLTVLARDNVRGSELSVDYRLPGGDWQSAGVAPVSIDTEGYAPSDLEVRLTDSSGNAGVSVPGLVQFHGSANDGGCNCGVGTSAKSAGGGVLLLLVVCLGISRRRRRAALAFLRRHVLIASAAMLAVAVPACSCGGDKQVCAVDPCLDGEPERGPTGRHNSIAASGDRVVVSAYEESLGDLVLIDVDDISDSETWTFTAVDGVPNDVLPVYDPKTSYRGGIAEPGVNVGAYTSVALRDGRAFIAYQDIDNGDLKIAIETSDGFEIHVVDDGGDGSAGAYADLSLDSAGQPTIAYMVVGLPSTSGDGLEAELRYATASSPEPRATADWSVDTVDTGAISCAGLCGSDSCVTDDASMGVVAERCAAIETCDPECGSGRVCVAGACIDEIPDPTAYDLPGGAGLFVTNMHVGGTPTVVYYDRVLGDLVIAEFQGAWSRADIDAGADRDSGYFATAIADSSGVIHVAYQDAVGDQLLYTTVTGGTVGTIEIIDDGTRAGESRTRAVGAGASIFLDSAGEVGVIYQDGAASDLLFAKRSGSAWTRGDLHVGVELTGFYNDIVTDAGRSLSSSYLYDRATFPPGELVISTVP